MADRFRICPQCGCQFQYEISRGNDRLYCSGECRRAIARAKRNKLTNSLECKVDGCHKHPRAVGSSLCDMHYSRLRRNGIIGTLPVKRTEKIKHSGGYVLVYAPGHVVGRGKAHVYEHRKIFYDANGEGPFKCHVCGANQTWDTMHIDHLDDDKTNNSIDNLAPSCPTCNQGRGRHKMVRTNQARGVQVTAFGKTMSMAQWVRETGVPRTTLARRLRNGWSAEEALSAHALSA